MARVPAVPLGDRNRQWRGFHLVNGHHPPLGLADNLLRHHQHVAIVDGGALGGGGVHNLRGQVVSGPHLGQSLNSNGANFRRHGAPLQYDYDGVSGGVSQLGDTSLSPTCSVLTKHAATGHGCQGC